jgi:hypothetical protein
LYHFPIVVELIDVGGVLVGDPVAAAVSEDETLGVESNSRTTCPVVAETITGICEED